MSLYPGKRYVGDTVRLAVNWQNEDGTDLDPSTDVTLKVRTPLGVITTYTYSDAEISKASSGDYYYEITTDQSGRWHYRWAASGSGTNKVVQGSFVVQTSAFDDDENDYTIPDYA